MWNLLTGRKSECSQLQDLLEDAATSDPLTLSLELFLDELPQAQRNHFAECLSCCQATQDLFAAREIFKGVASDAEVARPWFAHRVMAAIAAREKELSEVARTWLAVPKLASRLSLASAALLLVASTWLYGRPTSVPSLQATTLAAQESLFETPPPMNLDDVLNNLQENNQ